MCLRMSMCASAFVFRQSTYRVCQPFSTVSRGLFPLFSPHIWLGVKLQQFPSSNLQPFGRNWAQQWAVQGSSLMKNLIKNCLQEPEFWRSIWGLLLQNLLASLPAFCFSLRVLPIAEGQSQVHRSVVSFYSHLLQIRIIDKSNSGHHCEAAMWWGFLPQGISKNMCKRKPQVIG